MRVVASLYICVRNQEKSIDNEKIISQLGCAPGNTPAGRSGVCRVWYLCLRLPDDHIGRVVDADGCGQLVLLCGGGCGTSSENKALYKDFVKPYRAENK